MTTMRESVLDTELENENQTILVDWEELQYSGSNL